MVVPTLPNYKQRFGRTPVRTRSGKQPGGVMKRRNVTGGRAPSFASQMAQALLPAAASAVNPMLGLAAEGLMAALSPSSAGQIANGPRGKRYGSGRFAGYYKTKRISQKKRRRVQRKLNTSYMLSLERSFTQSPSISGIVGHATCPRGYMTRCMFGAMLKYLFLRMGVKCDPPTASLTPWANNSTITITFTYGAVTNDGFTATIASGATFTQTLQAVQNTWETKYDTLPASVVVTNLRFRTLEFRTTDSGTLGLPSMTLDISNAKVSYFVSSRLKLQNRSLNTPGDDDADDVDNVPVNVVQYSGYGTGCDSKYDYLGVSLMTDGDGVMNLSNPSNLGDAPIAVTFEGVKRTGFSRLQPGQIKTNVIKFNKSYRLDNLTRLLSIGRGDTQIKLPVGKYSFLHIEKTLEANQTAPVSMNIACENQLYMNCKFYLNYTNIPIPEFVRNG
nr:MAG: putative capsid protein [Arizlama virus]